MKFAVFLGDGMSDLPMVELEGRTPLMVARTPHLDRMVSKGIGGWSRNTPEGYYPGSDVANLGVLGYDVRGTYSGRSPLEATAMGVELGPSDVAFRCNLVTLSADGILMEDFSAGHISNEESVLLMQSLNELFADSGFRFYPGVGYRNLAVWSGGGDLLQCTPPHDISGQPIAAYLPQGMDAALPLQLMVRSRELLREHPVNRQRVAQGKKPASSIWLWGHGKRPRLASFHSKFGLSGGMISAVDLMRGIALNIGFEVYNVPGATGWIDTNYEGKASTCIRGLKEHDILFVHVEAPDEAGHAGRLDYKIQAIEDFDARVVGPVMAYLEEQGSFRALALPDHPTPVALRTHNRDPVPFAMVGTGIEPDDNHRYDEELLRRGSRSFDPGFHMMSAFLAEKG
ncbi:MAG: cofactor-independent phosphoglycerate mutase [Magnetococcales bacterium]|nr:cofactor-independent phosphoglycerate mutase [Magnetococcales bacterium]